MEDTEFEKLLRKHSESFKPVGGLMRSVAVQLQQIIDDCLNPNTCWFTDETICGVEWSADNSYSHYVLDWSGYWENFSPDPLDHFGLNEKEGE